MSAQQTIQARLDSQQTMDTITYGIRSVQLCRGARGSSPAHCAQIEAACEAASVLLDRGVFPDNSTLWFLRMAKRAAGEALAEAKRAESEIGTRSQARFALAA